ncbi:hypothetical protein ABZ038_12650 [Streptomyces sp. NPDC006349]|uniref:hypothetical protein n=1 Tax=Streptomyces sp. NPDC006349 TaxID=3156757 RepID=UPI0033A998F7
MAAAQNPEDINQIIAVGMDGDQLSIDGGRTWKKASLPEGTSAVGYDAAPPAAPCTPGRWTARGPASTAAPTAAPPGRPPRDGTP